MPMMSSSGASLLVPLLFVGCAQSPAPITPPSAPAAPAPSKATLVQEDEPQSPQARVPATEPTTDVPSSGSVTLKGLTIRVSDIMVKHLNTGGEMLRATGHLSAGGKAIEHVFHSDGDTFAWNGYLIEMRGGSNEAAGFAVVRTR